MNNLKFTDRELKGYNFENLVDKSINGNNFIRNSVRGVGSDFKHEYYPIELANLVRKYLEYLCIDKRTVQ
jgi:hypothetical protein